MSALLVISRVPHPGEGKTRLRRDVDSENADALVAAFVADTLAWAGALPHRLVVAYCGEENGWRANCGDALFVPQCEGDLGARIASATDWAHQMAGSPVVQIGTDSPTLPEHLITSCFDALRGADCAVIPSSDGGWVALGTRHPVGRALENIPWSTAQTLGATLMALGADRRTVHVLPAWYDVDTGDDLARLRADLQDGGVERAPRTAAVLAGMPLTR